MLQGAQPGAWPAGEYNLRFLRQSHKLMLKYEFVQIICKIEIVNLYRVYVICTDGGLARAGVTVSNGYLFIYRYWAKTDTLRLNTQVRQFYKHRC